MQALILAGGRGTDLRPLTVYTPKPVVPVMNRPLLYYQIEILKRAGVNNAALSLNYQKDKIEQFFGDGSDIGMNISYLTEHHDFGSAGAFKHANLNSEMSTIVIKSGVLTNLVIAKILKQHKETNAAATVCTTNKDCGHKSLFVNIDEDKNITKFSDHPLRADEDKDHASSMMAGIYVLSSEVFSIIKENIRSSLETDIIPEMAKSGLSVRAFNLDQYYWNYISTPLSYIKTHHDFLDGKIENFEIQKNEKIETAVTTYIDERSVVGKDCVIKPNVKIINSVIGEGVHIEEGAHIENSVLWSHTRIYDSAVIKNSILARSCYIGKNARVENSVLGDKTSLTDYSNT